MSPCPSSVSAPCWSRMVRESTFDDTWNAIRVGMFALIRPVMTSTDGRWVATRRWIPAARAFCARRAISSSTFLPDHHHQVGELVDDHHDVRQPLERQRVAGGDGVRILELLAALLGVGDLVVEPGEFRTPSHDISL